ncbi:MAG: protein kinase [Myxococcota bacterium]
MSGMLWGDYRLLRKVGRGGMSEVFLAHRAGPGGFRKQLVIKRLLPKFAHKKTRVERFLREAQVAALIEHPNIAHVSDFGAYEGQYYIAMEYVDGLTLAEILSQAGPLEPGLASRVLIDVLDALEAVHNANDLSGRPMNLVHRDVTPRNVMVSRHGSVKLIDFGIAVSADEKKTVPAGTKYFKSPEQVKNSALDHRSDIYSAGMLLKVSLEGLATLERTEVSIQNPASLIQILRRALAEAPQDRFETAGKFQSELETFAVSWGVRGTRVQLGKIANELMPQTGFSERQQYPEATIQPTNYGTTDRERPDSIPMQSAELPLYASQDKTEMLKHAIVGGLTLGAAIGLFALGTMRAESESATAPSIEASKVATTEVMPDLGHLSRMEEAPTPATNPQTPPPKKLRQKTADKAPISSPSGKPARKPKLSKRNPVAESATVNRAPEPKRERRDPEDANDNDRRTPREKAPEAPSSIAPSKPPSVTIRTKVRPSNDKSIGFITIDTTPWTKVFVDGQSIDFTPIAHLQVQSGVRTLRLLNPSKGIDHHHKIEIEPSKEVTVRILFNE